MLSEYLVVLGAAIGVLAVDVPFAINGGFQSASATSDEYNSGGSITVNGFTIQVPQNLQLQFPAAWVGFKDFAGSSSKYVGFNAEVIGNIVDDKPIAGQISFAQYLLDAASGYVEKVDFDGAIKIKGGPTIRINDPNAVYSKGYTEHPFFTADDANPSITSFSGFPMCVPRSENDELCPQSNRPTLTGGSKQGTFPAKDSLVMAPIVPGDFLEYSGIRVGGETIVYNMVVSNVQITTTGVPTYIRMEEALIGVWSGNGDQEVPQTRFVGLTSDASANVNPMKIYAIDVDGCTGEEKDREMYGTNVEGDPTRNKFEYRTKVSQATDATREYRIVAGTGTKKTKNGILAGQYVMPVSEWIQPEATRPGLAPFPNDFRTYTWMRQGLGYDDNKKLWGPLSPFPQSGVTTNDPSKCGPPPADTAAGDTAAGAGGAAGPAVPTTLTTSTSTAAATPSAVTYPDQVTVQTFTYTNSGSGTLSVSCRSNSTDAKVAMKLSYTAGGNSAANIVMLQGSGGLWSFSGNKVKTRPTQVTCKSFLGGSASRP